MTVKGTDTPQGLTREELLALPVAVNLETANRALSLSRTTGYDLARRGQYPCAVLRLGNAYRVVTADLLKLLHIDAPERADGERPATVTTEAQKGGVSRVSEEFVSDGRLSYVRSRQAVPAWCCP